MAELEELAKIVVDCGYHVHRDIGPGLLENVYEIILCEAISDRGLSFQRQVQVPIRYKHKLIDNAFRADIVVEDRLLVELKSTESHAAVHAKQLLTYLRLMDLPLGLLMNFGTASYKDGIRRIANNYYRLRS
jgi:iron complex transport system substrate-binding protein